MAGEKTVQLRDVCVKIGSGATPRGGKEAYKGGDTSLIRSQNVYNEGFHRDGLVYIDDDQSAELRNVEVKANDVLLNITGDSVARCCQVVVDVLPARVNQHVAIIRPEPKALDARFLRYVLVSHEYQSRLLALASAGATRPALTKSMIEELDVPSPPLAEQKAVASVLGALDDKIELNRRMNATLETMARALFHSWFVDFDPVHAKLDGRPAAVLDPATAALFPGSFQESTLGPIPQGWTIGTIDEATSLIIDYRGRTPKKMGSDWSPTGIPAVSARNVKGGRLVRPDTFNFVSAELYDRWMKDKLALGDVLMTSEAPLGELYYLALDARYCLSQRIFALRANPAMCEPIYLYYWLESPACQTDIVNRGTGTTVEGIRQSELRKVSVLLPPLSIQKAAAKFLATWTEQIHRNEEQSRRLAALRDNLLPKLLSGELCVSEIPPSE